MLTGIFMMKFGALLLGFISIGNVVRASQLFAAYMPRFIRKGEPYTIDVELLNKEDDPIDFEVQLQSNSEVKTLRFQLSSEADKHTHLEFEPFPLDHETSRNHFNYADIYIALRNNRTGDFVFSNSISVPISNKIASVFIETDKVIYQPGQTVKFRAVVTTPDHLPYNGTVSYRLEDPNRNIILKQSNAQLTYGVVGNEFKLGRYSALGVWSIIYDVHGTVTTRRVKVEKYKLVKWGMNLKVDQNKLQLGWKRITGEISAEHTFMQPVTGTAFIELTFKFGFYDQKITIHFPEFNGKETFDVDEETINQELGFNSSRDVEMVKLLASVTNNNTGETYTDSELLHAEREEIIVQSITESDIVRPGLPYVRRVSLSARKMRLSKSDQTPLSEEELRDLEITVEMTIHADFSTGPIPAEEMLRQSQYKRILPVTVGPNGIITVKTIIGGGDHYYAAAFGLKLSANDQNSYLHTWKESIMASASDNFIQVLAEDSTLAEGDIAKLKVYTTARPRSFRFFLVAREKILKSEVYQPPSFDTYDTYFSFNYSFKAEKEHSPRVQVVVSFLINGRYFVTDSVKLYIRPVLNEVAISAFPNKTDAGVPVSIQVKAEPGSFVGLRGIDQSVRLTQDGDDITREGILRDFNEYYGSPVGEFTAIRRGLHDAEILLLSNVRYLPELETEYGPMVPECSGDCADPVGSQIVTRSFFPETWIWTDGTTGDDGTVTFNYTVPDSITTWELSSFAVSHSKGLGAAEDVSRVTVFRNFFVSLDLPPSIVRGEILKMKATVFNYFDQDVLARVKLTDNEWYDIIAPENETASPEVFTITVPSKGSANVVFATKFMKPGNARIVLGVQSPLAADQVERTLRVMPEGIPRIVSHSSIIDRRNENEPDTIVNFNVDIPSDAVEGSAYVKFTVSGNIFGNALNNLENLLDVPVGCGEQNMLKFAPDVYISLYLEKVNQLTGKIEEKSKRHIREGYQNELRYQHRDGSFSAFGDSDQSGSTWLTAFVAKIFKSANKLDADLIEEKKIQKAVEFILSQQNGDGTFREPGHVLDKDMQGGVNSDKTIAAYILIALAEDGSHEMNERISASVLKTQRYLERNVIALDDIYTLSIAGYALSVVGSDLVEPVLRIIDAMATIRGNLKYWEKEEAGATRCSDTQSYCPYDTTSTSSSIEMTSYILLTYLNQGRMNETMPIFRWLVQQRGSFGGYHSTQDTVLAIQALSVVAEHFSERPLDLEISVTHDGQEDFGAFFQLSDENAIALQMAKIPDVAGNAIITGTGQGFADVQVTVGYNLPVGPRSDEPFVVDVIFKKLGDNVELEICSRVNENREGVIGGAGMYVVTFKLPSGYTIDDAKATERNRRAKLIELVDEEVTGYFDELPRGTTICMELELVKFADVENMRPKVLNCYDYYKPEISAMRIFTIPTEGQCPCCKQDSTVPCCLCEESSYCGTDAYPCPGFVDGLFYDSSSHISQLLASYPDGNSCTAPEGTGTYPGVPGLPASHLDGISQYIECTNVLHFEKMLTSPSGWTFSFAVYPTELRLRKRYNIVSISPETAGRPYVLLVKRERTNQYWLKILHEGQQMTVRSVLVKHIPRDRWSLVTARLDGFRPSLFVNGKKVGRYSIMRRRAEDAVEGPVTLKVGSSHFRSGGRYTGKFKGLVSSFDAWTKPLTNEEIIAHYNYWEPSINHANPTLDKAKVHHTVPQSIRKCFNKPYTAMELKSKAGSLNTDCN